jgi:hypothetical protein
MDNIRHGRRQNNPNQVLLSIALARQQQIALDPELYMHGLWAASVINNDKAKEAFLILNAFPRDFHIPEEAYSLIISICARYGNANLALDLIAKYRQQGYPYSEAVLRNLIMALIGKGDKYLLGKVRYFFREYYQGVQSRKWDPNRTLLEQIAIAMSYGEERGQETVTIIKSMTDCGFEPTFTLCCSLIAGALTAKETPVLKVMLVWCVENFPKHQLDEGMLHEICHVAVHTLDDDLSKLLIRLVESYVRRQSDANAIASVWYYYTWILSSIRKDNTIGILEALIETSNQGYDLYQLGMIDGDEILPSYGDVIRDALADCLTSRIVFQDQFYTALVDLIRNDYQVPKLALDALIVSTAKSGKQDRSFATFEEYQSLFGVQPDVHSYNGLLLSASYRVNRLEAMFSILQQMESKNIALNQSSYTILLDKMIDLNDFQDYQSIIDHMRSINLRPYPRILRKLAVTFATARDWTSLRDCLWMLACSQGNIQESQVMDLQQEKTRINYLLPKYGLPDFLLDRICIVVGDKELAMSNLQGGFNSVTPATSSS